MSKWDKLIERILSGGSDANLRFDDVSQLLLRIGYQVKVRGSHHIYERVSWPTLNLQPRGGHVKPYQARQVRAALTKMGLST